jgi:hypothetical protein
VTLPTQDDFTTLLTGVYASSGRPKLQRLGSIIWARYLEGKTFTQIAAEHGVTKERIRQQEFKAVLLLRTPRGRALVDSFPPGHPLRRRVFAGLEQLTTSTS